MEIILLPFSATDDAMSLLADGTAAVGWFDSKKPTESPLVTAINLAGKHEEQKKYPYLDLRQEQWGGLLTDGRNRQMYQLGPKAYLVLRELIFGERNTQISPAEKKEITEALIRFKLIDRLT